MIKKIIIIALIGLISKVCYAAEPPSESQYAFMMDYETGAVLLDKNGQERMSPASMSKLMLLYITFEMLKDGRLTLDTEIQVSENAWRKGGTKSGSSTMFLKPNSMVKLSDLIQGIIIQSGNDACVAIAEHVGGSEEGFVNIMNEVAEKLGLKSSHFSNVAGWPDPEHYMTAADLALLGKKLIEDYPEYYGYFAEKEFTYNKITQSNRNPLLYSMSGADGIKTGHTEESGFGLISSVKRGDRRLILVVNGLNTNKDRGKESQTLLEWGFREFNNYHLFKKGTKIEDAKVWNGKTNKVSLLINQDITVSLKPSEIKNIKVKTIYESPIPAPIKKGDKLARLEISTAEEGAAPAYIFDLVAGEDVNKVGIFGKIFKNIKYLAAGFSKE